MCSQTQIQYKYKYSRFSHRSTFVMTKQRQIQQACLQVFVMTIQKQYKYKYSRLSYRSTFEMRVQRQIQQALNFCIDKCRDYGKDKDKCDSAGSPAGKYMHRM